MAKRDLFSFVSETNFIRALYGRLRLFARSVSRRTLWVLVALPLFGIVLAATFVQVNWSGGVAADAGACTSLGGTWTGSECVAVHPGNQTSWTAYSSKDGNFAVVNGGADLQFGTVINSITQTSASDFMLTRNSSRTHTSDLDFSRGAALSSVSISGGTARLAISAHTPQWLATNPLGNNPDPGIYSAPAVADLDNDGDYDLLLGEYNGIAYGYENTGTNAAPVWAANTLWNTPDVSFYAAPALADLDNDGDYDLLLGELNGIAYGYENTGSKTAPVWTAKPAWNTPDISDKAVPAVADLDGDGDFDLIVGAINGIGYGYQNTGSASAPVWTARPAWNTPDIGTYSAPALADVDRDGDQDLLIGEFNGIAIAYENTGTSAAPAWTAKPSWNNPDVGFGAAPAFADLDNDGDFDVVLGSDNGILFAYRDSGAITYSGAPGTLTSPVIDTVSHNGFSTLDYTAAIPANTTLTIDVRAGDSAAPDGTWTAWQTSVASGADISALGKRRYVQYRANFATTNTAVTASLTQITINYDNYPLGSGAEVMNTGNDDGVGLKLNFNPSTANLITPFYSGNLHVAGNYAYLADDSGNSSSRMRIVNIANPAAPVQVAEASLGDRVMDVFVAGNYAYVAAAGVGLAIVDVTNPAAPVNRGAYNTPGWSLGVFVAGNHAYVADSTGGLQIINVSNPLTPVFAGSYDSPGTAERVFVSGNYAYLADGTSGLAIFDVSNPAAPALLTTYPGTAKGVFVVGNHAYVTGAGLKILNIANPAAPVLVGSSRDVTTGSDVYVQGSYAYVADGALRIINISDPAAPTLVASRETSVASAFAAGRYAYAANGDLAVITLGSYATSGIYTSAVLDAGAHLGYTTLAYTTSLPVGTGISVDARTGNTPLPDGSWTAWQPGIANGGNISSLGTNRYFQYRANLSTPDNTVTPVLQDVTLNFSRYATLATLTSSAYNTTDLGNLFDGLTWAQSLPAGSGVRIQVRSAPNNTGVPGAWGGWVGPDGSTNSYWDSTNTHGGGCGVAGNIVTCTAVPGVLRDGVSDQWIQYKVILVSDGSVTPVLSDLTMVYATPSSGASVSVTPVNGLTTTEAGGTATFNVVLTGAPSANVTFSLRSSDPTEGSVSPSSLTFTPGNWNTPQTVTVTGQNDDLDDDDIAYSIVTAATVSADPAFDDINPADVTVTNTDNDTAGITVNPGSGLVTTEAGGNATFTVRLDTQPTADVNIALSSSDTSEGTVSPAGLTFTASNWSTPQTVTATGVADVVIDGNIVYTIITAAAVSADPKYSGINIVDVAVTNNDTNTANITVAAPYGLVTSESGGFAPFTVRLTSQPSAPVTLMFSSGDTTEGFVSPSSSSMTFDADNWNQPQSGTIFGINDAIVDGNIAYNIVTSAFSSTDPNFNGANPSDIAMTNQDNDGYTINIMSTSEQITNENGGQASFTLSIGANPTAAVTVALSSSDPAEGVPSPSSITFNPGGIRSVQFTVKGIDDRLIDGTKSYSLITAAAVSADPNYNGVNAANMALSNNDNEFATLQLERNVANVQFGTMVSTADVNCDGRPDLIVGANRNPGEVYVYYGSATGYASTPSWYAQDTTTSTGFGNRVAGIGDLNGDGCDEIAVGAPSHNSNTGAVYIFYGSAGGLPDANGDGKGVPSDAAWRAIGNQMWSAFGSSIVSGDFDGNGYRDLAVATPDYNVDQTDEGRIYVFFNSAAGLPATAGVGTAQLSDAGWMFESNYAYSGMGWFRGLATANVNGDAYADLIIGIRYQANGQSNEGRVYAFYGSATGFNDAGGDKIAYPSDANWRAESDNANSYFGMSVANAGRVNGDTFDDIIVGAYQYTNGQTYEGAAFVFHGSATGLRTASAGDGIVRVATESDRMLEGNIAYSTFGTQVSGAGDVDNDGFEDVIVTASTSNSGTAFIYFGSATGVAAAPGWRYNYQGSDLFANFGGDVGKIGDVNGDGRADLYIAASALDNGQTDEGAVFVLRSAAQTPGFTVTPTAGLTTTESGGTGTFTVVLTAPPSATVTINLSSSNTAEGTVSPAQLVFDATNWNQPRTVTVTGANDALVDGLIAYTVQLAPAISTDSAYNGLDPFDVAVTNLDNEVPQTVTVTSVNGSEGSPGSLIFSRNGEITADLTVSYSVGGTTTAGVDYTVLSGSAVIPAGSASVTVPIVPINDGIDESDETVVVTLNATAGYSVGGTGNATATLADNDTAAVTVWPSSDLVTTESGGTAQFYIGLGSQPAADVTVNLASTDSTEGLVTPSSVTFTAANWSQMQTVTVVGVDDTLTDGNIVYNITTSAAISADAQYNGMAVADVAATNRDDDSLTNVSVVATQARVAESAISPGIFTVTRVGSTAAALTVFYSTSGTAARGVDYYPLTGTVTIPAGSTSAIVMVSPIQDTVAEADESIIMTLAGATDYIVDKPGAATVLISDDELPRSPTVNFTLDQRVAEGATVTVTAILSEAASAYPVTIPYTVSGTATNPVDHNAANGNIVINAGTTGSITFNVVSDAMAEPAETIVFTLGTPVNATTGTRTTHSITIMESNGAPLVALAPTQNSVETRLIVTGSGQVKVTANVSDPNPGDTHSYNWSSSNAALIDINDGNPATFVFNPGALTVGFYNVRLTVTDNGSPPLATPVDMLLEVTYAAPVLSNAVDSDNDGITDNIESFKDSDRDGIPDYLDIAALGSHELALMRATAGYIMRTDPGLLLRLGAVAFAAGADGAQVSVAEIAAYGGGESQAGSASAQDTVPNSGGYFDFEVAQLPQAGQSVRVVIPQLAPIPSGARYRKYSPVSGWRDFVIDANNALASAPGTPGECPPPGDPAFTPGLTTGHYCIQLTLQDGGPNDDDGLANRVVKDPGQLGRAESASTVTAPTSTSGGGGALDPVFLLYLLAVGMYLRRQRHWDGCNGKRIAATRAK